MVDEILRLAWQAERERRAGTCDTLLTLAAADSAATDPVLAERCRRRLIARRPRHAFARFRTLGQALEHRRVAAAIEGIRMTYPPGRVRWLLLQGDARRGAYRGAPRPIEAVCDDLFGSRRTRSQASSRRSQSAAPAQVAQLPTTPAASSLAGLYVAVLAALTGLVRETTQAGPRDSRAA